MQLGSLGSTSKPETVVALSIFAQVTTPPLTTAADDEEVPMAVAVPPTQYAKVRP
jgi:hypothetical protein